MDCNVIKDLIPLYIDGCCSEETKETVEKHIKACKNCKSLLDQMNQPFEASSVVETPKILSKINDWKASVMQSILLFLSFGLITIGVALESRTPVGLLNSFWAMNLVIPSTGFMLSLANWYFVRVYKNRKIFSTVSSLATLGITLCAYIWSVFHYEIGITQLFSFHYGMGILLTAFFVVLSKAFSSRYAKMLGKE